MPFDDSLWAPESAAPAMRRVQRRDDDQRLAALLVEGGIPPEDVYAVSDDEDVEDCVLSDDGEWVEERGRPLRRWSGFPSQAHAAQTRRGLFYMAFAAQRGIDRVRQIRISAPVCSLPLDTLRRVHAETSRDLLERLRYGIARYAPSLRVDLIAAEIVRDGPRCVYLHYHLVTRDGTLAELSALRQYWTTTRGGLTAGWDWWDAEMDTDDEDDDRTERHPSALVQYASKGLAAAIDETWSAEELAELCRQTRGVALVRAKGEYRRWLGDLDRDGLTVRRGEYGVAEIVPKRPQRLGIRRRRERLFTSAGFNVLRRLDYDFGDGICRRAWLVRGPAGLTMTDIAGVYVLGDVHSTDHAPIPESLRTMRLSRNRCPRPPSDTL